MNTKHWMVPVTPLEPDLAAWVDELGEWTDRLCEIASVSEEIAQEWVSFVVFTTGEWLWMHCRGEPRWEALQVGPLYADYARTGNLAPDEWIHIGLILRCLVLLLETGGLMDLEDARRIVAELEEHDPGPAMGAV